MELTTTTKTAPTLDPKRFIAAEVNLARLPFFASSTKGLKSKKAITYRRTEEVEGREVDILWEVTANAKHGYPGPFSEAIHAAILQIITARGLPIQNPIKFSFYDICKRLDLEPSGRTLNEIRSCILSTKLAGIAIGRSFQTKDGRRPHFLDVQHLYTRAIFFGSEDPETGAPIEYSAIWLADFYLNSINSGYIRPLDFEYFKLIRKASFAAPKLYQYLGYRFATSCFKHGNDYTRVDYDDLTIIADVKRQRFLSDAKNKLKKAHNILLQTNFLAREPQWIIEQQGKARPSKFSIRYYPGTRAREEYKHGRLTVTKQLDFFDDTTPALAVVHELIALGVTERRAKEIATQHPAEHIHHQLDHLGYLGEIQKAPADAAAWLVRAIEENYATPQGFKNRDQREAERKAQAEADAHRRQEEEQEHQALKESKARYRELDTKLAALSETERQRISQEIETRLRADFNPVLRRLYVTKPFDPKSPIHRSEYYQHLADLLQHTERVETPREPHSATTASERPKT